MNNQNLAEHYLKLEILYVNTKAACETLEEDGLTLENPWMQEIEEVKD